MSYLRLFLDVFNRNTIQLAPNPGSTSALYLGRPWRGLSHNTSLAIFDTELFAHYQTMPALYF